ncbi:hypothetical protein N8261_04540 [Flavobacteriaceae bacterium]|nr:hypothetical protein [Flavobacteriaceae bacterium]|tara:strand:+ start:630 stop:1022 length:393 start_codon:yes stop_codon:yes gene_type:complete
MCDFLDIDFDKDFVFMEKGGQITGGGFVFDSPLLKDTITNGSSMDIDKMQKGGGNILSALKDLAVPAGLLYTQKQIQKNNLVKYENNAEVIEEGVYDKLLSMIEPGNQKKHSIKTRRKREKKTKMSRRKK